MIRTIFIASVATLALAAPEADPALVYAGGLGLGYAGLPAAGLPLTAAHAVPHVPVVKSVVDTPAEVATEVTAHAVPVAVGYHGLGYYGKRSADADPALIAGLPYHAVGYTGLPLAAAHAVPHVPVVKSVDVTPAEVATEVTAHAVPVAVGYHGFGYYG